MTGCHCRETIPMRISAARDRVFHKPLIAQVGLLYVTADDLRARLDLSSREIALKTLSDRLRVEGLVEMLIDEKVVLISAAEHYHEFPLSKEKQQKMALNYKTDILDKMLSPSEEECKAVFEKLKDGIPQRLRMEVSYLYTRNLKSAKKLKAKFPKKATPFHGPANSRTDLPPPVALRLQALSKPGGSPENSSEILAINGGYYILHRMQTTLPPTYHDNMDMARLAATFGKFRIWLKDERKRIGFHINETQLQDTATFLLKIEAKK
jgi:hypothetical protein